METAKKVFVSMPMAGKNTQEIIRVQSEMLDLIKKIRHEDCLLIDSIVTDELSPLECLAESIRRMSAADYVVFAKGWKEARGCKIEFECANAYGIPWFDLENIYLV